MGHTNTQRGTDRNRRQAPLPLLAYYLPCPCLLALRAQPGLHLTDLGPLGRACLGMALALPLPHG